MMKTILYVKGVDCPNEVALIDNALRRLDGVNEVDTSIMTGKVMVSHDGAAGAEDFIAALAKEGLSAGPDDGEPPDAETSSQRSRLWSVGISGVLTSIGLLFQWMDWFPDPMERICFGAAIVAGGWFIAPGAIAAAKRFQPDMNLLMTLAVTGAIFIDQWSEGAAVTFLFALSELLESFSVSRARRAVQSLLDLTPETALLKDGNREVPVREVDTGTVILVRSGAKIPLDGEVVSGDSTVNQAPITGESMPVEKSTGDPVFAGTINGEGLLEVRVTKVFQDSTLSRIVQLVGEAQSQKAPSQRFVDVFARYYTPGVIVLAGLVFLIPPMVFAGEWSVWFYRALVLLVIACPCALVISTPVSIVSGLTAMARRGILVKGGAYLEAIGRLQALAVDKTGTITEGTPQIAKVVPVKAKSEQEVVRIAAAVDHDSDHPLAKAVVRYAEENGIDYPETVNHQTRTGRGVEAEIDGHPYFVGNHRFAHDLGVCSGEIEQRIAEFEDEARSVIVVGHRPHAGCEGEVLGIIGVGDKVRAHAAEAIKSLHKAGVRKIVMMSGDNQKTAAAIAEQVGIDQVHGDLLPEDKIDRLKELMTDYKHVGMVGDGVNDAPAMALATVGIAMGAAGTDTAIETADVALMRDDLRGIADAVEFGRRTVRVIQANITFALVVKAVFLVLAVFGVTSLWLAILADTGATLVVIANALRLLK